MKKFFALSIVMLAFTAGAFAQNMATAVATATIVQPITIANVDPLSFGNIVASAGGGTVTVIPAGTRSAVGVTLPTAVPGTVTAASFDVTGLADATFTITLPADGVVTLDDGAAGVAMAVDGFNHNSTAVLTGGTNSFAVGAVLTVNANQEAGTYTSTLGSGDFEVTVNYN